LALRIGPFSLPAASLAPGRGDPAGPRGGSKGAGRIRGSGSRARRGGRPSLPKGVSAGPGRAEEPPGGRAFGGGGVRLPSLGGSAPGGAFAFDLPAAIDDRLRTVPIYHLAKPQPRERAWRSQRGKKTLLSLTLVRLCEMSSEA